MKTDNKALFKMTWPIFIELLLQLLVGNMDQVQLSHFNDTAVAAVGNVNTIMSVIMLLFSVTARASMILITQYKGAKDNSKTNQLYSLSTLVNFILSVGVAVLIYLFATPVLHLLQVPNELLPEATIYLQIMAISLPFQAMMLTFSSFMRANAHMKNIMIITAFINIINVIGNACFINGYAFFPRLGASGAALSSTLCRLLGMVLMAVAFARSCPEAKVKLSVLRPWPKTLFKRLIEIGVPSAGESFSYNLSMASCLVFVNLMGTYVVTTRMYATMFSFCIYMLVAAVSQSSQIFTGYLIGANRKDEAQKRAWQVFKTFTPITLGVALLVAIFAKPLYGLFTNDVRIIALGQTIAIIEVLLEFGRCCNIILISNLQAAGDVKFPVIIGILSQWILGVGLCYVLGVVCNMGLVGIWLAFTIDECVRGIIFIVRWRSGVWKKFTTV